MGLYRVEERCGNRRAPTASSPHAADADILPIPAPREVTDAAFLGIPQPQKDPLSQGMLVRQYRFPYPLALSLRELGKRGP